ncbi:MAG: hypothetical protein GX316_10635 [Firmicutes bacterium]|nr:hypothetical protein [Bacillota bacterium]
MKKWLLVIISFLISVIVAAVMLNATGVINLRSLAIKQIEATPAVAPYLETYRAGRAMETELAKALAEVEIERDEFAQIQLELEARAEALQTREKQLARDFENLENERAKLLELQAEIDTAKMNLLELERIRDIYGEMKSKDAASIMSEMRPEVIAFLLSDMEPETAGGILSNLDPKLAAEITRMALTNKK